MRLIKSLLYQVQESDDLPRAICWRCVSKLEVCFELMQDHIRGQNMFRRQKFSQQMQLNCNHGEVIWVIFLILSSSAWINLHRSFVMAYT
jgi:hypothetical protein